MPRFTNQSLPFFLNSWNPFLGGTPTEIAAAIVATTASSRAQATSQTTATASNVSSSDDDAEDALAFDFLTDSRVRERWVTTRPESWWFETWPIRSFTLRTEPSSLKRRLHDAFRNDAPPNVSPYSGIIEALLHALDHPLKIREANDGSIEAVWLGGERFRFTPSNPAGVAEHLHHPEHVWQASTPTDIRQFLELFHSTTHHDHRLVYRLTQTVMEQIGDEMQTFSRRQVFWKNSAGPDQQRLSRLPLTWLNLESDFLKMAKIHLGLPPDLCETAVFDEISVRLHGRLQRETLSLMRRLERLHPLWRRVRRWAYRRGRISFSMRLWDVLHRSPQAMDEWERRLIEHPNAELLWEMALTYSDHPWPHLWQASYWRYLGVDSEQTWRFALRGPKSTVGAMLHVSEVDLLRRGMSPKFERLLMAAALPEARSMVPRMAWRALPTSILEQAYQVLAQHPHAQSWPVPAIRAFLREAQRLPWLKSGRSAPDWLHEAQLVWAELADWPADRSLNHPWSWSSLCHESWRRFVETQQLSGDWPAPFHAGAWGHGRITPIQTVQTWRRLGQRLHNCLTDERSDQQLKLCQTRKGVLVMVDADAQTSAALLSLQRRHPLDPLIWQVQEHLTSYNSTPLESHFDLVRRLVLAMNQDLRTTSRGHDRWRTSTHSSIPHEDVQAWRLLRDPSWSPSRSFGWWRVATAWARRIFFQRRDDPA